MEKNPTIADVALETKKRMAACFSSPPHSIKARRADRINKPTQRRLRYWLEWAGFLLSIVVIATAAVAFFRLYLDVAAWLLI